MIKVVMTTWDDGTGIRAEYAQHAIISLVDHLLCAREPIGLIIADDGTKDVDQVFEPVATIANEEWVPTQIMSPDHNGIGSSLNAALGLVEENDYWLYTTDDWVLTSTIMLDNALKLLNTGYDFVRLGPIHPNLECVTRFQVDIGWWLELCNTTGFSFATRPFIATKAFYNKVGRFLEGANSYIVEQDYAIRVTQKRHALNLASIELGNGPWIHIGDYAVGQIDP